MATEVKLPLLGENVPGGDVVEVHVKVGDTVAVEQPLFSVEADKSTVPIPAPVAGKISQLHVKKGDHVATGQAIAAIEEGDGKLASPTKAEHPAPAAKPKKEVAAPEQPERRAAPAPSAKPPASPAPRVAPPSDGGVVHAGPATRRLAREWGINLTQVPGSGVKGRVTQDDIKAYVHELAASGGRPSPLTPLPGGEGTRRPALPDFEKWGPIDAKPLDSIRKRTAAHMSLCWSVIPHVTHHDFADVTDLESFRKQQDEKGPKLTVTAFVLKALAVLLKQMPQFNASLDDAGGRIIYKSYYHLGVAVDTDKGLVVPVLRDVDKKSVQEIAREMAETADRARQGKLRPDDMQGGTFTVSNLGSIGGVAFSPIVNWPQVAILGLSRSRQQPVWKDGAWVPRLHLPMSLSYDHRVIDGAAAARFCRKLAELLENPLVMLLHA